MDDSMKKWCLAGVASVAVVGFGVYYFSAGRRGETVVGMSKKFYRHEERTENPLARYLSAHNREDPVLEKLRRETARLPSGRMVTTVETGKLLTLFCRAIGARKVIDIGVFTGCSAYAMAIGLPPDGRVVACDINMDNIKIGQPFWREGGIADKIDLRIQSAVQTLQELIDGGESETFDLVFIDADKANYPNYYKLSLQLLRTGGMFVVDNALLKGEVFMESVNTEDVVGIRTANCLMADGKSVEYVLLNADDGIGIAVKK